MNYHCQEGAFSLPTSDYLDSSAHILKFPSLDATLTLTRDQLPEGMTVTEYLCAQITQLQQNMTLHGLTEYTPFQTVELIDGIEFYCEPEQQGMHLYQYVAAYNLTGSLLVMTYCQIRPFTDADLQHWQTLKLNFARRP
ncbi:MAG TPA: hypothetical protein DIT05_04665 [Morganella sp. (in: Bacteria)]|nr:hypothetical protein [Morganella sp. (in: enterobacteria)]